MMAELMANEYLQLALKLSVLLVLLPATLVLGWVELKLGAHMQARLGPMYPGGYHGWGQTVADGIKFVLKENIIPRNVDRTVFGLVPYITMMGAAMMFVVIPAGENLVIENLEVGIFYALAAASVGVIGILMAGWASANKYSIIGAMRSASQLIAYELPLVFAAAAAAMMAGSLSLVDIVEAQKVIVVAGFYVPFLPFQIIGFSVFLIAATAELARPPFDMPIAEAELITGPFTEYTGIRFAFGFFAAEYIAMIGLAALAATLFMGGYAPPHQALEFVPGIVWLVLKTMTILFLMIWIRWSTPRLRADQLQKFAWKVMIPLTLLNILLTGALKLTPWI